VFQKWQATHIDLKEGNRNVWQFLSHVCILAKEENCPGNHPDFSLVPWWAHPRKMLCEREDTFSLSQVKHTQIQVHSLRADLAGCQGNLKQQLSGWCPGKKGPNLEEENLRAERKDWVWRDRNKYDRVLTAGYSYCLGKPTEAREPQHTCTKEIVTITPIPGW